MQILGVREYCLGTPTGQWKCGLRTISEILLLLIPLSVDSEIVRHREG